MKWWALLVFSIGCATRPPTRPSFTVPPNKPVHASAPTTLVPQPWRVGQWALYARTRNGHHSGLERISVVALDSCGTWIELALSENGEHVWTMCLRGNELQVVIEREGNGMRVIDVRTDPKARADYRWLVEQLSPKWAAGIPREDVSTFAGTFAQALKTSPVGGTRWSHPAVPFDGRVRFRAHDDSLRDELVAFGDTAPPSKWPTLVMMIASQEHQFGMRLGSSSSALFFTGQLGWRASRTVDVVMEAADGLEVPGEDLETGLWLMVGARWVPWRDSKRVLDRFYLRATTGYAQLQRTIDDETTTTARGLGFGATIGASVVERRRWSVSLEVSDYFGVFNRGEGVRHELAITAGVQLRLRGFAN